MTKYKVHLYREMRVYYPGVEAESPAEAAKNASGTDSCDAEDVEDCNGETLGALVDVDGDTDFANSEWIDFEPQRLLNAARNLQTAMQSILPNAESELASLHECHRRDGGLEEEVNACEAVVELGRKAMANAERRGA